MKTQELINYPQDKNTTSVAIKEIYSVINSVSESCLGISSRSIKSNKLHANSILRLNDQFILFLNEIENNDKAYSLIPFIRFLSKCNKDGKFDHSTFDNYKRVKEKFSELIPSFGDYKKYFAEKYCSSLEITDQDSYSIRLFKTIVNRDEVAINEVLCSSQIEPDHASDIMLFLALDALNCEDYDLFKFALSKLSGRDLTKAFRLSIFDSICSELKVLKLFSPIRRIHNKKLLYHVKNMIHWMY